MALKNLLGDLNLEATQLLVKQKLDDFLVRVGEVQVTPTANTLLDRVKTVKESVDSLKTESKTEADETQTAINTVNTTLTSRLPTNLDADGGLKTHTVRNNAFATLLNFQPLGPNQRMKRDAGASLAAAEFLGRNSTRAALDTDTTWEIVRLLKNATGELIDAQYKTGIAWSDRATTSHWDS